MIFKEELMRKLDACDDYLCTGDCSLESHESVLEWLDGVYGPDLVRDAAVVALDFLITNIHDTHLKDEAYRRFNSYVQAPDALERDIEGIRQVGKYIIEQENGLHETAAD